jgi:formylglycine-generating enzyme required for sulfatase activity
MRTKHKAFWLGILVLPMLVACGAARPSELSETPIVETTRASLAAGDTWTRSVDSMVMVYVPAGEFQMGNQKSDPCFALDQRPQHTVTLDHFRIDQTEVTVNQYQQCVIAGMCQAPQGCNFGPGEPTYEELSQEDYPMICLSWFEAQAYCEWVGGRLPTEAEWAYAARGPEAKRFPWGDEFGPNCSQGNFYDGDALKCSDGYTTTAPVGSFPAGASWCGVLDMAGNVAGWVSDWYGSYPALSGVVARANPTGPVLGEAKVVRGGGWRFPIEFACLPRRMASAPGIRAGFVGFRCVVMPEN